MPRMLTTRASAIPSVAEVFREFGFEGASVGRITDATGLGKGSLYNFFPGGKDEMAAAVLADIGEWFETRIFQPLRSSESPDQRLDSMFLAVIEYFRSGQRICLQGAFALGRERDRFSVAVKSYFTMWIEALHTCLASSSRSADESRAQALDVVSRIQGAIVLSRALGKPEVFVELMARARESLTLE